MKIVKESNRIIINDTEHFDPAATLECGQVFRFDKRGDNDYDVYSLDKKCRLNKIGDCVIIESVDIDYFINYFDLNTDYGLITTKLSSFEELSKPIAFGKGIRILKQNLAETILSFIISANNNIPRIKGIIERLCQNFGEKKDGYYAFPTLIQLKDVAVQTYRELGSGFRDRYLFNTVHTLLESDILITLPKLSTADASKMLLTLSGVGQKVADCILLFGLSRADSYPVDTWIFKENKSEILDTPQKVREYYLSRYGDLAGYAQQYIFYYGREK